MLLRNQILLWVIDCVVMEQAVRFPVGSFADILISFLCQHNVICNGQHLGEAILVHSYKYSNMVRVPLSVVTEGAGNDTKFPLSPSPNGVETFLGMDSTSSLFL